MGTLTSDTLHYKDKPTKCNSQASSTRGIGWLLSLRRAFLSHVLRVGFFIAFLSTLILDICICRHYVKG